jgi:hypothetical protein
MAETLSALVPKRWAIDEVGTTTTPIGATARATDGAVTPELAVGDDQAEGQRRERRAAGQAEESLHGRSGPPQGLMMPERSIGLNVVAFPLLFRVVCRYPVEQIDGAKDTCL